MRMAIPYSRTLLGPLQWYSVLDVYKRQLSCGFTYTHSEEAELTKDGEKVILDYYEVRK